MIGCHRLYRCVAVWLVLLSAPAVADPVTATLNGSIIISVTSGGYTALATELVNGVSDAHATLFGVGANADNLDLSTYFAKNGDAANWDVDLGAWIDTNGANPDFFVFPRWLAAGHILIPPGLLSLSPRARC